MTHSRLPLTHHVRSLMKKDGRVNIHGPRSIHDRLTDIYHYLFSLSWPKFFLCIFGLYVLINFCFAMVYFVLGVHPAEATHLSGLGHFKEAFFLSVETLTAIDYGRVEPSGWITYCVMTIQAVLGILTLATITGLFYARFSRPTAKLIFSNKAIIGRHNGRMYFYFRVANQRLNQIAEARIALTYSQNEVSLEGESSRKFYNLKLDRDYSPLFSLSWTVRHPINEESPLFGMSIEDMKKAEVAITVSLTGIDETFSQPILGRHIYAPEEIVFNRKFKDIILWQDNKVHVDLNAIHHLQDV